MRKGRKLRQQGAGLARGLVLFAAMGLVASSGCGGDGKLACYPVKGTVIVDGKPADGATVMFVPVGGSEEFNKQRPFSQTDASGTYELRTFKPGDGAPVGDYNVMIRWLSTTSQSAEADPDRGSGPAAVDRLRGRYFDPEKSGLSAKVEKGPNVIKPFELSVKAK